MPTELGANAYGLMVVAEPAQYRQQTAANPENELVDVKWLIYGLVLDIRYATPANLLGEVLYPKPVAYLRRPVAEALRAVQQALRAQGLGLLVFDAYRPYRVTVQMYEKIRDEEYAAPPWRGSRHNRGCSVDVGLVELASEKPVPMPTDFDVLSPAAHTAYADLPADILRNRTALIEAMTQLGFVSYAGEWWHFDHHRWAEFNLLDLAFEELES